MPLSITTITVELRGRVAPDITSIEVDGSPIIIAADRSWSHSLAVPLSTSSVAITAIAPTRTETRLVEVGAGIAPAAPA